MPSIKEVMVSRFNIDVEPMLKSLNKVETRLTEFSKPRKMGKIEFNAIQQTVAQVEAGLKRIVTQYGNVEKLANGKKLFLPDDRLSFTTVEKQSDAAVETIKQLKKQIDIINTSANTLGKAEGWKEFAREAQKAHTQLKDAFGDTSKIDPEFDKLFNRTAKESARIFENSFKQMASLRKEINKAQQSQLLAETPDNQSIYKQRLDSLREELKIQQQIAATAKDVMVDSGMADEVKRQEVAWASLSIELDRQEQQIKANTVLLKEQVQSVSKLYAESKKYSDQIVSAQLDKELSKYQKSLSSLGNLSQSVLFGVGLSIENTLTEGLRSGIEALKSYENGITDLRRTLQGVTEGELSELGKKAVDLAKEFGVAVTDVQNAMTELARAGVSDIENLQDLTRTVSIGLNTTEIATADEMVGFLISTIKQLDLEMANSMEIIDTWNYLSDQYAVHSDDFALAIQRAGSASKNFGLSLQEVNAMVTILGEATQQSGEVIGSALRAMEVRLLRPDTIKTLESYGIAVKKNEEEFLSFRDIMNNVSDVISDLDDNSVALSNIMDAMGGSWRKNWITTLTSNWGQFDTLVEEQINAVGYSLKENERAMDTWEKRIEQMKQAWTEWLLVSAEETDLTQLLKDLTSMVTGIAQLLTDTKIGNILITYGEGLAIIKGIGAFGSKFGGANVFKEIVGQLPGLKSVNTVLEATVKKISELDMSDALKSKIAAVFDAKHGTDVVKRLEADKLQKMMESVSAQYDDYISKLSAVRGFSSDDIIAALNEENGAREKLAGLTDAEFESISKLHREKKGVTETYEAATAAINGQSAASALLRDQNRELVRSQFATNAIMILASVAIGALVQAIVDFIHSEENAIKAGQDLRNDLEGTFSELENTKSTIDGLSDSFTSLSKGVDDQGRNISLTADEYSEYQSIVNQLIDMFPSLIQGYNAEGDAIVNRNTVLAEAIELYEKEKAAAIAAAATMENITTIGVGYANEAKRVDHSGSQALNNLIGDLWSNSRFAGDIDTNEWRIAIAEAVESLDYEGAVQYFEDNIAHSITWSKVSDEIKDEYNEALRLAFSQQEEGNRIKGQIRNQLFDVVNYAKSTLTRDLSDASTELLNTFVQNIDTTQYYHDGFFDASIFAESREELIQLTKVLSDAGPEGQAAAHGLQAVRSTLAEGNISIADFRDGLNSSLNAMIVNIPDLLGAMGVEDKDGLIGALGLEQALEELKSLEHEMTGLLAGSGMVQNYLSLPVDQLRSAHDIIETLGRSFILQDGEAESLFDLFTMGDDTESQIANLQRFADVAKELGVNSSSIQEVFKSFGDIGWDTDLGPQIDALEDFATILDTIGLDVEEDGDAISNLFESFDRQALVDLKEGLATGKITVDEYNVSLRNIIQTFMDTVEASDEVRSQIDAITSALSKGVDRSAMYTAIETLQKHMDSLAGSTGTQKALQAMGLSDSITSLQSKMEQAAAEMDIEAYEVMSIYLTRAQAAAELTGNAFDVLTGQLGVYNAAVAEQNANGFITTETYQRLIGVNADYADALEATGNGFKLNAESLRNTTAAMVDLTKEQVAQKRLALYEEYNKNAKAIGELSASLSSQSKLEQVLTTGLIESYEQRNSAIRDQIDNYKLLYASLNDVTRAVNAYNEASGASSVTSNRDTASGAIDVLGKVVGGELGSLSSEAQAAVDLLGRDMYDALVGSGESPKEAIRQLHDNTSKWLIDSEKDAVKFIRQLAGMNIGKIIEGEDGSRSLFLMKSDVADIAEELGVSAEYAQILMDVMGSYFGTLTPSNIEEVAQIYSDLFRLIEDGGEQKLQLAGDVKDLSPDDLNQLVDTLTELGATVVDINGNPIDFGNLLSPPETVAEQLEKLNEELAALGVLITDINGNKSINAALLLDTKEIEDALPILEAYAQTVDAIITDAFGKAVDKDKLLEALSADSIADKLSGLAQLNIPVPGVKFDVSNTKVTLDVKKLVEQGLSADDIADLQKNLQDSLGDGFQIDLVGEGGVSLDTRDIDSAVQSIRDKTSSLGASADNVTESFNTLGGSVDAASEKVENLAGKKIGTLGAETTTISLSKVNNYLTTINQQLNKLNGKSIHIKSVVTGGGSGSSSSSGSRKISGATASGTFNAKGGLTLVGEPDKFGNLAPELVAENGRAYMVGTEGAEFVTLSPGAQVFNAEDTRKILARSRASLSGSVPSFASGNIRSAAIGYNIPSYKDFSDRTGVSVGVPDVDVDTGNVDKLKESLEDINFEIEKLNHSITMLGEIDTVEEIDQQMAMLYTQIELNEQAVEAIQKVLAKTKDKATIKELTQEMWGFEEAILSAKGEIEDLLVQRVEIKFQVNDEAIKHIEDTIDMMGDIDTLDEQSSYIHKMRAQEELILENIRIAKKELASEDLTTAERKALEEYLVSYRKDLVDVRDTISDTLLEWREGWFERYDDLITDARNKTEMLGDIDTVNEKYEQIANLSREMDVWAQKRQKAVELLQFEGTEHIDARGIEQAKQVIEECDLALVECGESYNDLVSELGQMQIGFIDDDIKELEHSIAMLGEIDTVDEISQQMDIMREQMVLAADQLDIAKQSFKAAQEQGDIELMRYWTDQIHALEEQAISTTQKLEDLSVQQIELHFEVYDEAIEDLEDTISRMGNIDTLSEQSVYIDQLQKQYKQVNKAIDDANAQLAAGLLNEAQHEAVLALIQDYQEQAASIVDSLREANLEYYEMREATLELKINAMGNIDTAEERTKEAQIQGEIYRTTMEAIDAEKKRHEESIAFLRENVDDQEELNRLLAEENQYHEQTMLELEAKRVAYDDMVKDAVRATLEQEKANRLADAEIRYEREKAKLERDIYDGSTQDAFEKAAQDRINAIQDQIDAINDEAEALDKIAEREELINDIAELRIKLQNTLLNKNTQILKKLEDGTWDFEYVADPDAVLDAQEELADKEKEFADWEIDLARDKEIERLEELIEGEGKILDEKADAYEEGLDLLEKAYEAEIAMIEDHYSDMDRMVEDAFKELQQIYGDSWDKVLAICQEKLEGFTDIGDAMEIQAKRMAAIAAQMAALEASARASYEAAKAYESYTSSVGQPTADAAASVGESVAESGVIGGVTGAITSALTGALATTSTPTPSTTSSVVSSSTTSAVTNNNTSNDNSKNVNVGTVNITTASSKNSALYSLYHQLSNKKNLK